MSRIALVASLFAMGWMLYAQPAPRPTFEVASVKPSAANCNGPGRNSGPTPGRLELPCVPVRPLIRSAYGAFTGDQIAARAMQVVGGPAWLDTDRYDISAKADGTPSATQMMGPMLQTLLEERFHLKVHVEAKESPVYALTVAKSASKLTPWKEGSCVPLDLSNPSLWSGGGPTPCGVPKMSMKAGVSILDVGGATMEEFAGRILTGQAGRPVVDKTGLTGRYDLHLEYTREDTAGPVRLNGMSQPVPPPSDSAGPSIFTALQEQLGLKLSPDKAPLNVIVIDSVQKPTEN
jgi:uncharacterized protein (TIGR03435 family)